MRTILFATLTLVAGFALGWICRPEPKAPLSREVKTSAGSEAAAAMPAPAVYAASVITATEPKRAETFRNRVETIRWLKQSGVPMFINTLSSGTLSPALGKLLELTSDEMTRLNDASSNAKRELAAAQDARATSHTSEDGKTLVVDVPPVDVSASRAIYDRLLDTFQSTLGSDRYAFFNEVAEESYEHS